MTRFRIEYRATQRVEVDANNLADALDMAIMKQDDRRWTIGRDCLVSEMVDGQWVQQGVFDI